MDGWMDVKVVGKKGAKDAMDTNGEWINKMRKFI